MPGRVTNPKKQWRNVQLLLPNQEGVSLYIHTSNEHDSVLMGENQIRWF